MPASPEQKTDSRSERRKTEKKHDKATRKRTCQESRNKKHERPSYNTEMCTYSAWAHMTDCMQIFFIGGYSFWRTNRNQAGREMFPGISSPGAPTWRSWRWGSLFHFFPQSLHATAFFHKVIDEVNSVLVNLLILVNAHQCEQLLHVWVQVVHLGHKPSSQHCSCSNMDADDYFDLPLKKHRHLVSYIYTSNGWFYFYPLVHNIVLAVSMRPAGDVH